MAGDYQTDGALLGLFAEHRDEAAFTLVVDRHAAMVFNVCRKVLGNSQDAEDAAQAAFLILSKRASGLQANRTVAAWLHSVAYSVAVDALRRRNAHRKREEEAAMLFQQRSNPLRETHEANVAESGLALVEELGAVPKKYRDALVLFHLEGQSLEQTATVLQCPVNTVSSRLARGRDLLKSRLVRRGIATTAVALAASLSAHAGATELPAGFVSATVKSASAFVSGHTAAAGVAASPQVATLAKGGLNAILMMKLKLGACVIVVLMASGAGVVAYQARAEHPVAAVQGIPVPAQASDAPRKNEKDESAAAQPAAFSITGTPGASLSKILDKKITVHYVWRYPREVLVDLGTQTGLLYSIPYALTAFDMRPVHTLTLEGEYTVRQVLEQMAAELKWDLDYRDSAVAIWERQDEKLLTSVQQALDKDDLNASLTSLRTLRFFSDKRAYPLLSRALASEHEEIAGEAIDILFELSIKSHEFGSTGSTYLHRLDALACSNAVGAIVDSLVKLANAPPPFISRNQILHLLQISGDPRGLEPAIESLKHPYLPVRIAAIDALGDSRDPRVFTMLRQLAGSRDDRIREAVARALGRSNDPAAVDALLEMVRDNPSDRSELIRKTALNGLKNINHSGDPRVVEFVKTLLTMPARAGRVLGSLPQLDQPGMLQLLLPYAASDQQAVRFEAATALGETQDEGALEPLSRLARDSDQTVRSTALYALGNIGRPGAASILKTLSDTAGPNDQSNLWLINSMYAEALGCAHGPKDVEELVRLYKIDPKMANVRVMIQAICDPALTDEWLSRCKKDPSLFGLVSLREPRRADLMLKFLGDPDVDVRREALLQVGFQNRYDARYLAALEKLENDKDAEVRLIALQTKKFCNKMNVVALASGSEDERTDAAWALFTEKYSEATEMLPKLYADPSEKVRKAAGESICQLGYAAHIDLLVSMLKNGTQIEQKAILGLMRTHSRKAAQALAAHLKSAAKVDKNTLQQLQQLNDPEYIDRAAKAMASVNEDDALSAREVLAASQDLRVVGTLIPCLKNPNARVRNWTAYVLGELDDPRADNALWDAIQNNTDPNFSENVLSSFAMTRDERHVDPLIACMKSKQPNLAARARGLLRVYFDDIPRAVRAVKDTPETTAEPKKPNPANRPPPDAEF